MEESVLREHWSNLYKALLASEPSRRSVTAELYAKNMISRDERNKISQLETSHNANEAATEILNRIETFVKFCPTDFNKVLQVLKQEGVLATMVMSMENRLSPPQPGASAMKLSAMKLSAMTKSAITPLAMTPLVMTPLLAAPQPLVPTEHGGPRGITLLHIYVVQQQGVASAYTYYTCISRL